MGESLGLSSHCVMEVEDVIPHSYWVTKLNPKDPQEWLSKIADEYLRLRLANYIEFIKSAGEIPTDFDGTKVLNRIMRLLKAVIPERSLVKNFGDVIRSDFGETIAFLLLAEKFGTQFGYQGIRDREIKNSPGRGLDVIGLEFIDGEKKVSLILGEVKVSDESKSPPQVVDSGKECLRMQHQSHLSNLEKTAEKIIDATRTVQDSSKRTKFFEAANLLAEGDWDSIQVVTFCLLVRSSTSHDKNDFGTFRSASADYAPASIRFVLVVTPSSIEEVVEQWYEIINERKKDYADSTAQ